MQNTKAPKSVAHLDVHHRGSESEEESGVCGSQRGGGRWMEEDVPCVKTVEQLEMHLWLIYNNKKSSHTLVLFDFRCPQSVITYHEGKCSHLPHTDSDIIQMVQFCKLTKLNNSIIHRSNCCCGSWCEVKNSRGN